MSQELQARALARQAAVEEWAVLVIEEAEQRMAAEAAGQALRRMPRQYNAEPAARADLRRVLGEKAHEYLKVQVRLQEAKRKVDALATTEELRAQERGV